MTKEARRAQIRAAAVPIFLEKGFKNTRMRDIVNAAKLSRGGVYYHYKNTADILEDIILHDATDRRYEIVSNYKEKNPHMDRRSFIENMMLDKLFDRTDYKKLYIMFLIQMYEDPELADVYEDMSYKLTEDFTNYTRENNYPELLAFNSPEFSFFINAMYLGSYLTPDFEKNKDKIMKMVLGMFSPLISMKTEETK